MNLIQKLIDVIDDKNINDIFNGINNLSKYSYIINNTIRSHLKKIGISENHDDFNGFCKDFTRLIIMSNNASADVIMSPVYKSLNEKIDRLGINDEIENLFKIFGLEEDE